MSLNTASLRSSLNSYAGVLANRQDLSTEGLNHGAELIRKIDAAIEQVQSKESSIIESKVLNDVGKSQALAELATASVSRFGFLSRVIEKQESDIINTRATLFTVKPPDKFGTDESVRYAYGLEIRNAYAGLNQNERIAKFVAASQQSDDAILWAMLASPVPMVTPEILNGALEERARRLNPATLSRLRELELLHETLSGLRDAVVIWLRGLGGDPKKIFDELGGEQPAPSPIEVSRRMVSA